jgi:Fe-S oxidoreductase
VAALERLLPWMAATRAVGNAVVASRPGRAALARLGLVALPALDEVDLRQALHARGVRDAAPALLARIPAAERSRHVVVVQDAFTSYYDAAVVLDLCELLTRLGFTPWLAPFKPNGKPQHVLGFLGAFERTARDNAAMLAALAASGVALIGVDPSMTLAYRAEYVKALGKDRVPDIALPQEWLARHLDEVTAPESATTERWALLPHCTERTNAPRAVSDWQRVARRLGVDLTVLPSGCCGMAGLYGHERDNRARSQAIYRLSWAHHLADPARAGRIVATGYSCRTQAKLVDATRLMHPAQMLLARVKGRRDAPAERSPSAAPVPLAHHEEY